MADLRLRKTMMGYVPADEESMQTHKKHKLGEVYHGDFKGERNNKFHRKFFALLNVGFEAWCETDRKATYKDTVVEPNFERFRKDVTIMAGYYDATFNVRGEVRLEAKSIKFTKMDQEEFERLYSKTIDVIIGKVLPSGRYTKEQLNEVVMQVIGDFA